MYSELIRTSKMKLFSVKWLKDVIYFRNKHSECTFVYEDVCSVSTLTFVYLMCV